MYKIGDRVLVVNNKSAFYNTSGVIQNIVPEQEKYYVKFDDVNCSIWFMHHHLKTPVQAEREQYTNWFKNAYSAIYEAGGNPSSILNKIPIEIIDTFVRNNIQLVYETNSED